MTARHGLPTDAATTPRDDQDAVERLRASRRKWYANNQGKAKAQVQNRKHDLQRFINDLKSSRSCRQCGETHPACLEFYPRPGREADSGQTMVRKGWSLERIGQELQECEVLCANCHSKRAWTTPLTHEQSQTRGAAAL